MKKFPYSLINGLWNNVPITCLKISKWNKKIQLTKIKEVRKAIENYRKTSTIILVRMLSCDT